MLNVISKECDRSVIKTMHSKLKERHPWQAHTYTWNQPMDSSWGWLIGFVWQFSLHCWLMLLTGTRCPDTFRWNTDWRKSSTVLQRLDRRPREIDPRTYNLMFIHYLRQYLCNIASQVYPNPNHSPTCTCKTQRKDKHGKSRRHKRCEN